MADALKKSKTSRALIAVVAASAIILLLVLFLVLQMSAAKAQSYQTSELFISQIEGIIDNNESRTSTLVESIKEDYVTRAKAVAYIVDENPAIADDLDELAKVAELVSVDEVHLFDETGTIVGGTVPRYYGYSFDSGEQMAYFKPMIDDRDLTMCQDVTPNTAESKSMMYAICWNAAKDRMVQVGIEPVRLIDELHSGEIIEIVADMPAYDGTEIVVTDRDGIVVGASQQDDIGRSISSPGFDLMSHDLSQGYEFEATIHGQPSFCVAHAHGDYIIAVAESKVAAYKGIPISMGIVLAYLLLAAGILSFVVVRMTRTIVEEQRNATVDPMTGFHNRRAYEMVLAESEGTAPNRNFVYAALDLNGLKAANDERGHEAGDELIRGCAECMQRCFGNYGRLFRIGGDEFAALFFADGNSVQRIERDFEEATAAWSERNGMLLSVSNGMARAADNPDADLKDLAKIADTNMYEAKRHYYESAANDRRHPGNDRRRSTR